MTTADDDDIYRRSYHYSVSSETASVCNDGDPTSGQTLPLRIFDEQRHGLSAQARHFSRRFESKHTILMT